LSQSEFSAYFGKYADVKKAVLVFKALDVNKTGDITVKDFKILGKLNKQNAKAASPLGSPKTARSADNSLRLTPIDAKRRPATR